MFGALLFALAVSAIEAKPEFRTPFENVTWEAGKWVYLVCAAEGEKPMTYKWYDQDENEMTEDDKHSVYTRGDSSSLFFKNVSSEHEGSYTCIASNAHGLASKVFFLRVPPSNGTKPEFLIPFENVTMAPDRYVELMCRAEGEKPLTYKWYTQDNHEITQDDHNLPVFVRKGAIYSSLVILNVRIEHEGLYTCNASNAHGLASKVFNLTVPHPKGPKPEFRTPFENFTLAAGRYVSLPCKAEGEQPMTYKWYNQDMDEMTEDDKQPVFVREYTSDSSLVFRNLSHEQEGSYTCTASNAHGLASKVFFITVPPPNGTVPEFRIPFENVTLAAGRYVHLLCKAEGEQPMTYKWYNQDMDEMTEDDEQPVFVRKWTSDSSLVFRNLSREQEGLYTCTANNSYGLASKVFFLTVPPPNDGNDTDIDRGNGTSRFQDAKVLRYTTRSVTFYITTSGPVKYIEAKYREGNRAPNTTTIRLNPAPGNRSYVIDNLLPSGLYIFQFRTVPSDSNKWSREYNVTLLPDAPEIILESTCDQSVRLQWFMNTDDVLRGTIDRHQIKYFPVERVDGSRWTSRNCTAVTTEVPTCVGSSYTIWGLERTIFHQIEVRAHTAAGYGEPWRQKVYLPPAWS